MSSDVSVTVDCCHICGGTTWERWPAPFRWTGPAVFDVHRSVFGVVRCRQCSLFFTSPQPSQNLLAAFYTGEILRERVR